MMYHTDGLLVGSVTYGKKKNVSVGGGHEAS